jgi:hypothetical protein
VLHFQRKRQKQLAEREAAGENLWTASILPPVAMRICIGWLDLTNTEVIEFHAREAFRLVLLDTGMDLTQYAAGGTNGDKFGNALTLTEFAPSLIEAFIGSMRRQGWKTEDLERVLNTIFAQERVAFEFIGDEMVEFQSKELHSVVVAPTLRLLSGRAGWENVEAAYQKALKEIGQDPSDAITDAGTALQEALAVLGCRGNALGPRADDARRRGLLAPYDGKIIDWVSADRSGKGDAHNATPASREDAWLAVHVVGALILRLAGGANRVE